MERLPGIVSIGPRDGFQIPGRWAQRDDDYSFVRTLVEIHRQVATNYVDLSMRPSRGWGRLRMLAQLDPFTVYIPPLQQEGFDRMLEWLFGGVGIQLNQAG